MGLLHLFLDNVEKYVDIRLLRENAEATTKI